MNRRRRRSLSPHRISGVEPVTPETGRRLIVFRHAKSDWDADHATDRDRPLNRRGEGSARVMGTVLARAGEVPELAITSSARRARTTLDLAIEAGGWDTEVRVDDALYDTSVDRAIDVIAGAPAEVRRLMVVGHEPAWSSLVHWLTGGSVAVKTATAVGIDLPAPGWEGLAEEDGVIAYVLSPRLFGGEAWRIGDDRRRRER
jgi:phosphohistidine phosphatase